MPNCELCGEPMPAGEEMFKFHGYSGPCPLKRQTYPVQNRPRRDSHINAKLYLAAYEVYCHCYGEQKALIEGWCRGGFGVNEVIAFLYARAFPKQEWKARVKEAFENMSL